MCAATASLPTPSFSFSLDPPGSPSQQHHQQQQHHQPYDPPPTFFGPLPTSPDPHTMAGSVGWHSDFFNPWTDPAGPMTAPPGYEFEAARPSTAPSLLPSRQAVRSSARLQAVPRRLTPAGSSSDEEGDLRRASDLANVEASAAEAARLAGLTIARASTKRRTASPDASEESGCEAAKRGSSAAEEEDASRKKRSRTLTTPSQQARLLQVLQQTRFPSTELREELAVELGMTPRRVQIWFQNRRQGMKKAMDERAEAERAAAARHDAAVYLPEDTSRGYSFGAYPTPFIAPSQVQQPPPPPKTGRAPPGSAFLPPQNRMMPNNHPPADYSTPRFEALPFGQNFDARTVQMPAPAPPFDPRHQRRHTAPESVTWPHPPSSLVPHHADSPAFSFEAPLSTAPSSLFGLGALATAAGVRPTSSPAAPLSSTSTSTNVNGPPDVDFAAHSFELFLTGAASLPPELLGFVDDTGSASGAMDGHRPTTSAGPAPWSSANGLLM